MARRNSGPSLGDILAEMLAEARASQGAPVRRTLAGGLRVDFLMTSTVGSGRGLKVQISRSDASPSLTEWDTVLSYLPGCPKSNGNPAPPEHWFVADRHYMASGWLLPTERDAALAAGQLELFDLEFFDEEAEDD